MLRTIFPSFAGGRAGTALLFLRAFVGVAFLFHGYGKAARATLKHQNYDQKNEARTRQDDAAPGGITDD